MLEIPRDLTPNDLHQWISDGVVVRKGDKTITPLFVWTVEENCSAMVRPVTNRIPATFRDRFLLSANDMLCGWPTCGAVNVGGIALYVQRTQVRQYRRTYNSRGLVATVPDAAAARQFDNNLYVHVQNFPTFTREVYATEANGYPTTEQALASLLEPNVFSVALSPSIIVTKALHTDDLRVWHNNELVAKVLDRTTLLPLCGAVPRAVKKRLGGLYVNM